MTACDRCEAIPDRSIKTYWGNLLCPSCVTSVVAALDRHKQWPPFPDDPIPASLPGDAT